VDGSEHFKCLDGYTPGSRYELNFCAEHEAFFDSMFQASFVEDLVCQGFSLKKTNVRG
jgi:hypothetical protein